MLPDKNKLNNEIIEQVTGGGSYPRLLDPLQGVNPTQEAEITPARAIPSAGTTKSSYIPLYSGKQCSATEQHTDNQSSKREEHIMPKIAPVGSDLKTTVPEFSDMKGSVKIH